MLPLGARQQKQSKAYLSFACMDSIDSMSFFLCFSGKSATPSRGIMLKCQREAEEQLGRTRPSSCHWQPYNSDPTTQNQACVSLIA